MKGKRSYHLQNMLLMAAFSMITVVIIECILRVFDFPRQPMNMEHVKDPTLVYRMPTDWPGIDDDGYRNPYVPEQADIVTLGDSHTYGYNADYDNNWPSCLGTLTGMSVYNLSVGGYGPLQYYYLFNRALQLKPRFIIVGLYLPNDIMDVCVAYQETDYWKKRAKKEGLDLAFCGQISSVKEARVSVSQTIRQTIVNSKVGALISIAASPMLAYFPKDSGQYVIVSTGNNTTIISKKRIQELLDNTDLKQAKVSGCLDITKTLISRMALLSGEKGVKLLFMIIPSREYIFYQYLSASRKDLPETYKQMAASENKLREAVKGWLTTQNISYVDINNDLLEAVRTRGHIYPNKNDGHPMPAGYEVYAKSLCNEYFISPK